MQNVKKKKSIVTLGVIHIKATFNNTHVTVTDVLGNKFASSTSGENGFKGARKATPYAAQVTVEQAAVKAKERGLKTVSLRIKGAGSQRESAIRAVFNQGFIVTEVADVSPIPHNGCKRPKRRRV